jgi:hypothetical protein
MRTQEDLKTLRLEVMASVTIDAEMLDEDPIWSVLSDRFDLTNPAQYKAALQDYVRYYLDRNVLLDNAPSTCGPATTIATKVELIQGEKE